MHSFAWMSQIQQKQWDQYFSLGSWAIDNAQQSLPFANANICQCSFLRSFHRSFDVILHGNDEGQKMAAKTGNWRAILRPSPLFSVPRPSLAEGRGNNTTRLALFAKSSKLRCAVLVHRLPCEICTWDSSRLSISRSQLTCFR